MFSTGQLVFAGSFVLAFIIIMVYSYRKDIKLHKKHYKNSYFILIGFISFVCLLFFLKYYLK